MNDNLKDRPLCMSAEQVVTNLRSREAEFRLTAEEPTRGNKLFSYFTSGEAKAAADQLKWAADMVENNLVKTS